MAQQQQSVDLPAEPGAQWRIWEGLPKPGGGAPSGGGARGGGTIDLYEGSDGGGAASGGAGGGGTIDLYEGSDGGGGAGGGGAAGGSVDLPAEPGAVWRILAGLPKGAQAGGGNPFAPPGTGGSGPTPRHGTPVRGHGRTSSKGNAHNVRGHMRNG